MISSDWLQIVLSIIGVLIGAIISYIFFRAQQVTDFNHLRESVYQLGRYLDNYQKEIYEIHRESVDRLGKGLAIYQKEIYEINLRTMKELDDSQKGIYEINARTMKEMDGTQKEIYEINLRTMRELDNYQREIHEIHSRTIDATDKMDRAVTEVVETLGRTKQLIDIAERLESRDEIISIRATVEEINSNLDNAVTSILSGIRDQQKGLSVSVQERFDEQAKIAVRVIEDSIQRELSNLVTSPTEQADLKSKFVDLIEQAINRMGEFQRINIEQQSDTLLITVEQQVKGAVKEVVEGVNDLKDQIDSSSLTLVASLQSGQKRLGSGEE